MTTAEESAPRPGSPTDLSRRMDRLEQNHEALVGQVVSLAGTVARVELNQQHAEELNKLRFGALDQAVGSIAEKLDTFMARVEGVITGEVQTAQSRRGQELVADYQQWRAGVEDRLDKHDRFETQGRLLGRIAVLMVTSNLIAIIAAVAAFMKPV